MNKPQWKDAPEWAEWLAMDDDLKWFWFEVEPFVEHGRWIEYENRIKDAEVIGGVFWTKSLEGRP